MIPYQRLCAIMSWIISGWGGIKSSFQQAQEAALAAMRLGRLGSGQGFTAVYRWKMTIFTQILEGLNPGVALPTLPAIQTFQIKSGILSWVGFQAVPPRVDRRTHVNVVTTFCRSKLISPPCLNVNCCAPRFHDSFSIYVAINLRFISFVTKKL